jgi:hypothetical protein
VQSWIAESPRTVDVLPTDRARAEAVLLALQVTTRSPMGAIALETGGILIDRGWLRVLGGGGSRMDGDLARWNGMGQRPIIERTDGLLLVAHDAIGGFFALDGGSLGEGKGGVFYVAWLGERGGRRGARPRHLDRPAALDEGEPPHREGFAEARSRR